MSSKSQNNFKDFERLNKNSSDDRISQAYKDYGGLVYGCSLRILRNRHHAEDVTQATFILFSKKFKDISDKVKIGGWLYKTATLIAKSERRNEGKRIKTEKEIAKIDTKEMSDWQEVAHQIDELIAILPEKQRNAILLKYMQGKSQEEIGALMNCSRGTVSSWISRGLESLRKKLRKKGIVLTGSALTMMTVRLKVESSASLNSTVLQGISDSGETPLVILKSYTSSQASLKLKMIASGLVVILAVTGYFLFSASQDQSFSTHKIEKNEASKVIQPKVLSKKKFKASPKQVIPEIHPIVIGQSNLAFAGKIEDITVSPDGQAMAVLTRMEGTTYYIYLVDARENKLINKVIIDNFVSVISFAGNDQLVFREHPREDFNKITIYDIRASQVLHELTIPAIYGGPLASSRHGKLYVSGCYEFYSFQNEGKLSEMFDKFHQKRINDCFDSFKKDFASENPQKIELSKNQLKYVGLEVENYDDFIKNKTKIKNAIADKFFALDPKDLMRSFNESRVDDDILVFDLNSGQLSDVIENVPRYGFYIQGLLLNDDKNELVILDSANPQILRSKGSKERHQTITRYDLSTSRTIQTIKNMIHPILSTTYLKWGNKDTLLGSKIIDFNESKIERNHLRSFDFDSKSGKVYRVYKGAEGRDNGNVFLIGGEDPEQGIVCEDPYSGKEFFRIKLDRTFDHIRLNPFTNELILWKEGSSSYVRFDLDNQKLVEESKDGFSSIPYQIFFKGNSDLLVEESNNFHTFDLKSGTETGKFHFDKNTQHNTSKSFIINNDKNLLTGGCQDGKAHILNLDNGKKIKSIGEGYLDNGGSADYGLEYINLNKQADLVALKLNYRGRLDVHKISTGEKIFSLKSDSWKHGTADNSSEKNIYTKFNDSGSLMYLADNGNNSAVTKSGIYHLQSGDHKPFTLKSGKEVSLIYDMIVNEEANLVFMRTMHSYFTHHTGIWNATTGKCIKEFKSLVDVEYIYKTNSAKIVVEGISDDGKYLLTRSGAYDIENDCFAWNWQDISDEHKPSGTTIIDETHTTVINIWNEIITIKDIISGEILQQFRLILPEGNLPSINGGIWSSEINKLVLKLKEPEVWILDLG